MTIGKSSKKSAKAPKFLDVAGGFYGRLDEPELERGRDEEAVEREQAEGRAGGGGKVQTREKGRNGKQEPGVFDFNQGMLEDDGTATLLRGTPIRRSSRWRRKSGSKKRAEARPEVSASAGESAPPDVADEITVEVDLTEAQTQQAERILVHFSVREEADDQVLISEKADRETEGQRAEEVKVAKMGKLKNYRKTLDRALRRGWEAFVSNLYSVTLTPISSSKTSSPSPAGVGQTSAITEYR